jgi:hypothetical protein
LDVLFDVRRSMPIVAIASGVPFKIPRQFALSLPLRHQIYDGMDRLNPTS